MNIHQDSPTGRTFTSPLQARVGEGGQEWGEIQKKQVQRNQPLFSRRWKSGHKSWWRDGPFEPRFLFRLRDNEAGKRPCSGAYQLKRGRWTSREILGLTRNSFTHLQAQCLGGFRGKVEKRLNHLKYVTKGVGGRGKFQQLPSNSLEARDAHFLLLPSVIKPDTGLPWQSLISSFPFIEFPQLDGRTRQGSFMWEKLPLASPTPCVFVAHTNASPLNHILVLLCSTLDASDHKPESWGPQLLENTHPAPDNAFGQGQLQSSLSAGCSGSHPGDPKSLQFPRMTGPFGQHVPHLLFSVKDR